MSAKKIEYRYGYMERAEYDRWVAAGIGVLCDDRGEPLCDIGPDDVEEVTFLLPAKNEICDRCGGDGKHVHSGIDGNGITRSEWAEWDHDEQASYFRGDYDVTCEECGGEKVMLCIDWDALKGLPEDIQKRLWGGDDDDYYDAEEEAERRYFSQWG